METGGRVPCLLYGIFMFIFMGHLFFLLKISCAFLEVGNGEVERKNYFSISLTKLLSGLEPLPTSGFSTSFHAHFWTSSLTCSSPDPSCFNERKALQSHPLIFEILQYGPMSFHFSRWQETEFTEHRKSEHLFLWVCMMSFILKQHHPLPPPSHTHRAKVLNLEGKQQKGNSYWGKVLYVEGQSSLAPVNGLIELGRLLARG